MKFLFNGEEKNALTLKEAFLNNFYLIKSNKIEVDELTELLNNKQYNEEKYPHIKNIYMCGHIKEVTNKNCLDIIPIVREIKDPYDTNKYPKKIKEYKCYFKNDNKFNNVIIHEDALSSFKGACNLLNTEYFIVIRIK
jgi:hypothetical protein